MADYTNARWDDSVQSRFWANVSKASDGCWHWTGVTARNGYGRFSLDGKTYAAHRLAYCKTVAMVADNKVCDHLCRSRSCVNPAHIDPVSNAENLQRGIGALAAKMRCASVTHCPKGHEYSPGNTRVDTIGRRSCKTCHNTRTRLYRAIARAQVQP